MKKYYKFKPAVLITLSLVSGLFITQWLSSILTPIVGPSLFYGGDEFTFCLWLILSLACLPVFYYMRFLMNLDSKKKNCKN